MLHDYGRLLRTAKVIQWHARRVSTTQPESVEPKSPKKRGRPKLDQGGAKRSVVGQKEKEKDHGDGVEDGDQNVKKTRKRSAKAPKIDSPKAEDDELPNNRTTPKRPRRQQSTDSNRIPARLLAPTSRNHHDLPSFLAYAARTNRNPNSTVYKGTLYEYTVASTLRSLKFRLHRTGRSNDLGIDLVGHWNLPSQNHPQGQAHELRVLVQCKALQPLPSTVRELEGAYAGAPAGWREEGVLALLVASQAGTKGVREALQRSRWPMGVMQVTREGELRQVLWNAVAARVGLEGLGVGVRYEEGGEGGRVRERIALTWMGELWRPVQAGKK